MKSIIISTPLIPATLDGRKTMTRRTRGLDEINKNPDIWQFLKCDYLDYMTRKSSKGKFGAYFKTEKLQPRTMNICPVVFPYGQPGDKLWVKTKWWADKEGAVYFPVDNNDRTMAWHSPLFMPRWASRITLEIINVRVERIQEISENDARAEGINISKLSDGGERIADNYDTMPRVMFAELWDSINAKKGYGWEKNVWVWVLEFRRIKGG